MSMINEQIILNEADRKYCEICGVLLADFKFYDEFLCEDHAKAKAKMIWKM